MVGICVEQRRALEEFEAWWYNYMAVTYIAFAALAVELKSRDLVN